MGKEIKYIAVYQFNDDNNLYCVSLDELKLFIQKFIEYKWYDNVYQFLQDYTIYKVTLVKDNTILNIIE